jgi:FkbM family methyltransferase
MLLNLHDLIEKYNLKITGVIQAGAHEGQEVFWFKNNGITKGHFFEPCEIYWKLAAEVSTTKDVSFHSYHVGLSDHNGYETMNVSVWNLGMSNSLLKPKKHLEYYPSIAFEETEVVLVNRLDDFKITDCNLLVMDVQGAELLVLKGATETLKHIDYIYTEVNIQEMYEGCALMGDLDNYLKDFTRVETKLTRKRSWGDALYIKKPL